jgi:glycosyltransferase involved in cell wall biosynthesis
MVAERFDAVVAAYGPGPLRDAAAAAGVPFVALQHVRRALSPWRDPRGLAELVGLMRRFRPDLVHLNSSKAGVLGAVAARVARVPLVVFTVNGWAFRNFADARTARVYLAGARLIGRLADRVVCVAEQERRWGIEAGAIRPDQAVVIWNAVDVGAAKRARHEPRTPPVLVSVGRFAYPKDFVTLVRALGLLGKGSFRTLVVGDGPERAELEAELARSGADVQLLGERGDVPQLLAEADVFCLSSRSEGLPLSILEAMAAGLPVVASAVGGVPEQVADGETGFLVPPGDETALAAALERLAGDAELRGRLGAAGRARAEERFDLPHVREAHLRLYSELLAARGLPIP